MSGFPRVWIFDINRRVYDKAERSGPIWREHWMELEIVGETKVSWISSYGTKIPKKGGPGIAFSEDEINRAAYVNDNAYRISAEVGRIRDYDLLKSVAALVGYEEGK